MHKRNLHAPTLYKYIALRAFSYLRSGRLQALRHGEGDHVRSYAELLALPCMELYDSMPCFIQFQDEERLEERGMSLLRDLSSEDLSNIPDAGIRCAKCKSSEIAFDFLQTRSADEGTTVYCTCTSCGKRWKM